MYIQITKGGACGTLKLALVERTLEYSVHMQGGQAQSVTRGGRGEWDRYSTSAVSYGMLS